MTRSSFAVLTLLGCVAVLLSLGAWAARRTHNAMDFAVANRRMGVWLSALGYSANVLNAWMLLLMSAAAFTLGYAAVWLWAGAVLGGVINLFYVAPRLRSAALGQSSVTLLQVLSADAGDRLQPLVVRSAVLISVTLLSLQIAAALRGAMLAFVGDLGFEFATISVLCVAVIGACVFAGGMRGAAAIEAAQGGLLLTVSLLLLAPALVALGGWEQVEVAIGALEHVWTDAFGGKTGVVAIAFAGGGVGLGLAMTGQPQALNRFMAARDETTLRRVRWVALAWTAVLLGSVLTGGWAAHLLYAGLEHPEQSLFAIANRLLPPWLSAIMTTGLAIAVAISIAGPLFAIATSLAVDLRRSSAQLSAPWMRTALLLAAVLGLALSAFGPAALLDQTLFSFTTLGAALGPLVLVRLSGKRIRPGSTLGAMWSAFVLSLLFHLLPDSPGDFLERVLPFVAALGVALSGGERRRNPDRADRGQETVHDRIPI